MIYAQVIGFAHSTVYHASMRGVRLLLCETMDRQTGKGKGDCFLAADWLGAGSGSMVMVSTDGEAASRRIGDDSTPLRNVVLGILDDEKSEAVA